MLLTPSCPIFLALILCISAVKFIRDQAEAVVAMEVKQEEDVEKIRTGQGTAQAAAAVLRKIVKGETSKSSVEVCADEGLQKIDPLEGWASGVLLRKSHCCLLLKPQVVLRGEGPKDTCIVAAMQAKLQSFAIMDKSNADDPVSGKVMSRYAQTTALE